MRNKFYLIIVAIGFLALILRLTGLGSFMTVDEERWMLRSGEFYEKLFDKKDPGGTFTTSHPGATTQWLAGAGIYWQEKNLGIGIDTSNLREFRRVSTVPIAVAVAALIMVITVLTVRLMGHWVGVWGGILLATEPYLIGMSQVVHVDMLLALFMLGSALCLLLYVDDRRQRWLLLAGMFMGLSFGTKLMPAVWLAIFSGIVLFFDKSWLLREGWQKKVWMRQLRNAVRAGGLIAGVAMLVFYVVWPALWVKTNLDDYYQRDVVSVATQEHIDQAESSDPIEPATFYARTVLSRTTPFVLFIAFGVFLVLIKYILATIAFRHFVGRIARHDNKRNKKVFVTAGTVGWLVLYAIGYLLLITLAAKKADRYAMPALVVLPILAGSGLVIAWSLLKEKSELLKSGDLRKSAILVMVAAILLQTTAWMPYTISYNSDLFDLRPLSQQGWGEGLDAAGRWLNESAWVDELMIASWYPGVMGTYFEGQTMSLSSRSDDRVGYVVTYRNMGGRAQDDIATNVLEEYEDKKPVYTVDIGGQEYAWIYETIGLHYFPKNVGELTGGMEVGQIVTAPENWDSIEVGMSNFSSRVNTREVILHIREGVNAGDDIRRVSVNASEIEDGQWHKFEFEAIEGQAGKDFYVALSSPASVPGDAVTVRFVDRDVIDGAMLWRNRALEKDETNEKFVRPGFDMAYRLPTK